MRERMKTVRRRRRKEEADHWNRRHATPATTRCVRCRIVAVLAMEEGKEEGTERKRQEKEKQKEREEEREGGNRERREGRKL